MGHVLVQGGSVYFREVRFELVLIVGPVNAGDQHPSDAPHGSRRFVPSGKLHPEECIVLVSIRPRQVRRADDPRRNLGEGLCPHEVIGDGPRLRNETERLGLGEDQAVE
ncbi:hypothetical protein SDC9_148108 [bioreactor metagenome]|uniref:Uncharacterized protein n=1 Tax=bioreactor metagenome TaxID=1076179 RepID=A0A645EHV9_9ZZZZ